MKREEISMLKILYLIAIAFNVLAIVSHFDYSNFTELILPFNAILIITLKFSEVITNLGTVMIKARYSKGGK